MAVPQVSVRIGGKDLDIFDSRDFPLSLDFQIEDVIDFTKRKGSGSSKTFKVPATVNNDKIFNLFGTYSSDSDSVKIFEDIEIFYDGIPFSSGSAVLRSVTTGRGKYRRKAKEYEIFFLLENSDWFFKMDGKTLDELSFTNHLYDIPNISGGYWDGLLSFADYGYTFIKWKNWYNQSPGYLVYEDLTPFLYISDIIEKAFLSIGYTLDSNFLTSAFAERLILPVPLKEYGNDIKDLFFNMRASNTSDQIFSPTPPFGGIVEFDDDSTSPNFDNGGNFNTGTFTYTVPQGGTYRIRANFDIDSITSGAAAPYLFTRAVFVNGVIDISTVEGFNINNGDTLELDYSLTLSAGDTVEIAVSTAASTTGYTVKAGGNLEITAIELPYVLGETTINWSFLVEKYPLRDLIAGVSELFNLYIFADPGTRIVRIEPRKDFFDQRKDRNFDIDLSRDGSKTFTQLPLNTIYQYLPDSNDDTVKNFKGNAELEILSAKYVSSNPVATGTQKKTNSFFAPTIHLKDDTISGLDNTDTAPQIPLIYPEDFLEDNTVTVTDFDFLPRILYHKGVTTFDGASTTPAPEGSISFLSKAPTTRSGYPKSFAVNYDDQAGTDPNLSYSRETLYTGVTVAGLLEEYFLDHLATLNNGVQLTEFLRLKITDIISLNYREKIFLSGIDYILQKIDKYTPVSGRSTKVILLEDICASSDDLAALENTTLQDVIKI